jgi:superfamily II DNA or RNA helicase
MSIEVHVDTVSHTELHALSKDLVVSPIAKRNEKYSKVIKVEAFKLNIQQRTIIIPLAYSKKIKNLRVVPKPSHVNIDFNFHGELLQRQQEITDETIDLLSKNNTILLSLYTGFGKTIYALWVVSVLKYKTLVLCHRKIIIEQWGESIKKYLPGTTWCILDPKIKDYSKYNIVIANVINIPKFGETMYSDFGTLVIDEIHTVCTEKFSTSLKSLFPKYAIGLSATPDRSDGMDRIIDLYIGTDRIVRKMWRIFNVYKLETGIKPEYTTTADGTMNWNSVLQSLAQNSDRNLLLCNIISYFRHRTILVLVKLIDHAKLLQDLLTNMGIQVSTFMNTDKFVNYTSPVLIATYSKGGVGFDHPGLDMLLLAADVEENFMQYLGRVFRKDTTFPIVVDLVDQLSSCKTHSTSRNSVYKEVGGTVHKFEKVFPNFFDHFTSSEQ